MKDAAAIPLVRSILLVGCNARALPLIAEYARYAAAAGERFRMSIVSIRLAQDAALQQQVEDLVTRNADVLEADVRARDCIQPGVIAALAPESFDAVIVLGESVASDAEDDDTRVIMILLLLRTLRAEAARAGRPFPAAQQVVGEIADPANEQLALSTRTANDVVISTDVVSRIISQLCREPDLEHVFTDLFDEAGVEIYLRPAARYGGGVRTFAELLAASLQHGEVAVGWDAGGTDGPRINPPKDARLTITPEARLIVFAQDEAPSRDRGV